MRTEQKKFETKIGYLYIVASEKGIKGVFWEKQNCAMSEGHSDAIKILLENAVEQINEYLEGKRKVFELPIDQEGSEFQLRVWKELNNIPYGETRSYKQVATSIEAENASRAVGTANAQNPLCILVPCHRVISSDGSLGGYSGGLNIKKFLLDLEMSGRN